MNELAPPKTDEESVQSKFQPHAKIKQRHQQLGAVVYVRQSTSAQLREHQESTARQYAMKDRLIALGWPESDVHVIDDDLGISGSGSAERPGFQRLLKLVTDQKVGIVAGLEMSRLARNSKDWSDLFEVCAIFATLIADEDGIYDPHDPNDRLVLGLKGIISEMELHTMKVRLERGRLSKAERGELFHDVPVGYVLDENRLPQLDPDESAQHVLRMFFDLFESLGSSNALFHHLNKHNIKLPFRHRQPQVANAIDWRLASKTMVYEMLKHPLYAGAYGYSRKKKYGSKGPKNAGKKHLPPEQWKVLLIDRHPAYITWQQYLDNQSRLQNNDSRPDRSGPVREGTALLCGLVRCGHCGRRMAVNYPKNSQPLYYCMRRHTVALADSCHNSIRCEILDSFIVSKLLEVLSPVGVELSLRVIQDEQVRRTQMDRLYADRVEQARYVVDLAERRYQSVDPANRLVASQLESQWEEALKQLGSSHEELNQLRCRQATTLDDAECDEIQRCSADIISLWHDRLESTDRKEIARLMIRRVKVAVQNNTQHVDVQLLWSGGYESSHQIIRTVTTYPQMDGYEALMDRMLELTLAGKRSRQVAAILDQEGYLSPRRGAPISASMVGKLMHDHGRSHKQLTDPTLGENEWRVSDLSVHLGIPEKRLKDWVTRGWASAVQRPFGRMWVIWANSHEQDRLQQLHGCQTGQGRPGPPETLRIPTEKPRKSR